MVARALENRQIAGGCFVDVGCGQGDLHRYVGPRFTRYVGIDAVRYDHFPEEAEFCHLDLDGGHIPLPDRYADVVAAVEVIEHLENPRDFLRKLVRLAKPGGWVIVTTPNQLSLLSLATLVLKQRFQAFQDVHYPTHLTALLEVDLRRIGTECGLVEIAVEYSRAGRLPLSAHHFPRLLADRFPRCLSDNVLMIGRRMNG
jgi:2-polyprenyl-3-methyl-5-hydroxy-6-metoxy-1,4-benzoquinol methylase